MEADYTYKLFNSKIIIEKNVSSNGSFNNKLSINNNQRGIELNDSSVESAVRLLKRAKIKKENEDRSYKSESTRMLALYYIYKRLHKLVIEKYPAVARYNVYFNSTSSTISITDIEVSIHYYLYIGIHENCKISTVYDKKLRYYPAKKHVDIEEIFKTKLSSIQDMKALMNDTNKFLRRIKKLQNAKENYR